MCTLETAYSFMMVLPIQQPTWKIKWAIRKARRNTRRTVKSMVNRMMCNIQIVVLPVGMYETLCVSIDAMMDKMNCKRAKVRKKPKKTKHLRWVSEEASLSSRRSSPSRMTLSRPLLPQEATWISTLPFFDRLFKQSVHRMTTVTVIL